MPMQELSETNIARLEKERKYFQKVIGGGRWTPNHALTEIFKILDNIDTEARREKKTPFI